MVTPAIPRPTATNLGWAGVCSLTTPSRRGWPSTAGGSKERRRPRGARRADGGRGFLTPAPLLGPPSSPHVTRYVISSLELLVAEDYMIVYLNGATPRRRMPGIGWLKKFYQMIDRR